MTLNLLLSASDGQDRRDIDGERDQLILDEIMSLAPAVTAGPSRVELGREGSWELLAWVERMASAAVRHRSVERLAATVAGLALADRSAIDTRDILVVSAVCGRASELLGLDWAQVCSVAAPLVDHAALDWLHSIAGSAASGLPPTYVESGSGSDFSFRRRPVDWDPMTELADFLDDSPA